MDGWFCSITKASCGATQSKETTTCKFYWFSIWICLQIGNLQTEWLSSGVPSKQTQKRGPSKDKHPNEVFASQKRVPIDFSLQQPQTSINPPTPGKKRTHLSHSLLDLLELRWLHLEDLPARKKKHMCVKDLGFIPCYRVRSFVLGGGGAENLVSQSPEPQQRKRQGMSHVHLLIRWWASLTWEFMSANLKCCAPTINLVFHRHGQNEKVTWRLRPSFSNSMANFSLDSLDRTDPTSPPARAVYHPPRRKKKKTGSGAPPRPSTPGSGPASARRAGRCRSLSGRRAWPCGLAA